MQAQAPDRAGASSTKPSAARWFGVGRSANPDSTLAGAEAAELAMRGADGKLIVVFASDAHQLADLLSGIRSRTHDIPLIGCSTAGEIASDGPGDAGVVVVALGGPGFVARTAASRGVAARLRDAGAEVAACAGTAPGHGHQALLLLSDGLAGDQTEIVRGAYSVMGAATPLVGGCAGDGLRMQRTRQLFDAEVLDDAVVGAWLGFRCSPGHRRPARLEPCRQPDAGHRL